MASGSHDYRAVPGLHTAGMSTGTDPVIDDGKPSPDWEIVETLGVADIVMIILGARKTMPSATAATVSRERRGDVFHVRVSLLDGLPSPPGGNRPEPGRIDGPGQVIADFAACRLGQDLIDAFGNNDAIILK
jgi:hypothetical protein